MQEMWALEKIWRKWHFPHELWQQQVVLSMWQRMMLQLTDGLPVICVCICIYEHNMYLDSHTSAYDISAILSFFEMHEACCLQMYFVFVNIFLHLIP